MVHTYHQLIGLIANKMRDVFTSVKNTETAKNLFNEDLEKLSNNESLSLLHEVSNDIAERMIIYGAKSHLKVLKDQEDATFASCPKFINQLQFIHTEVDERVVPFIYCLMIENNQENYCAHYEDDQEKDTEDSTGGARDQAYFSRKVTQGSCCINKTQYLNLILFDFEATQSMVSREFFDSANQGY
ncbi:hypothetical protein DSO57_1007285 [Entomophthora muscae]|uniref:Uncharacterized protein n=1 Tax=Entomophthora muscae TaxID=34485 RepID=A0ACC2USF3_9FUNG|nr:hypothetical protein DSO57_1007285 [Entomophthora muscae]